MWAIIWIKWRVGHFDHDVSLNHRQFIMIKIPNLNLKSYHIDCIFKKKEVLWFVSFFDIHNKKIPLIPQISLISQISLTCISLISEINPPLGWMCYGLGHELFFRILLIFALPSTQKWTWIIKLSLTCFFTLCIVLFLNLITGIKENKIICIYYSIN